jgi:hypothetical protein
MARFINRVLFLWALIMYAQGDVTNGASLLLGAYFIYAARWVLVAREGSQSGTQ